MKRTLLLIAFVITVFSTQAFRRPVIITFEKTKDEIFTKPQLKALFAENPSPAILIRMPNGKDNVSSGQSGISGMEFTNAEKNQVVSAIEKNLILSGFSVRDRAIYEKVLDKMNNGDYSKMADLTGTDLVLEVVDISLEEYHTNTVERKGEDKSYNCNFSGFYGWKVEMKIISVKLNEVVGLYTFYKTPCTKGCNFELDMHCNLLSPKIKRVKDKEGNYSPFVYKVDIDGAKLDGFGNAIAKKLIEAMK